MPISIVPQVPDYRVTESGLVKAAGRVSLYGVMLTPAGADSSLILYDSLDGSGTSVYYFTAPKNGPTVFVDLTNLGPKKFSVGIYAVIAGSGAMATIWCA